MANEIYNFDNPGDYTFDSDKITVSGGKAILKETSDFNGLVGYWKFEDNYEDSSVNGLDGTPVGSVAFIDGIIERGIDCPGVDDGVSLPTDPVLDIGLNPKTVAFWIRWTDDHRGDIIEIGDVASFAGYGFNTRTGGKIQWSWHAGGGYTAYSTIGGLNDGNWHFIVGVSYPGSYNKLYIDGVDRTDYNSAYGRHFDAENRIAIGKYEDFKGDLDEIAIWSRALSETEIVDLYNSGIGRHLNKYPSDKPTIKPNSSWNPSGVSEFFGFAEILGGGNESSLAYQLSDNDGVDWRYWNGSDWVITGDPANYNDTTVIGANIEDFPVANEKILFKAFLISDGEQQCELDSIELTAVLGYPPNVYAGSSKNCKDHEIKKPFIDAVIGDPDGDIEQATAWYNIEGSGWTQIPKGGYGTLQEAIRNFQYAFDNIGTINCQLKIIDQGSKETIDDMNMTVEKYTVTFNIKDKDGNHLANFQFLPDDSSDWQSKNSPFIWEYDYYATNRDVIFDKVGFQTQHIEVEISDHIENVTLNILGAVSPEEVADAVWDELISGHTIANSFGEKNQKVVPSENTDDYKTDLSNVKDNTDKIPNIKNETDKIEPEIINKKDDYKADLTELLGLSKKNYRILNPNYNTDHQLTSATVKIYANKTDCNNNQNPIAEYSVIAEYNQSGEMTNYKVVKE